jgi:ArsR family transcriptional regulator, arsenate/arsenite/antimonite-responsive transcriptional repressor
LLIKENMPIREENQNRFKSTVFHALSDPIRLEILSYLANGEKCVCDIVPHLNLIQPLISRHLKILRDAGILRCRKDGTKRMYSIVEPRILNVIDALTVEVVDSLAKEAFKNMTCG